MAVWVEFSKFCISLSKNRWPFGYKFKILYFSVKRWMAIRVHFSKVLYFAVKSQIAVWVRHSFFTAISFFTVTVVTVKVSYFAVKNEWPFEYTQSKLIKAINKRKSHSQCQHFRNISQHDFEKNMENDFINKSYL